MIDQKLKQTSTELTESSSSVSRNTNRVATPPTSPTRSCTNVVHQQQRNNYRSSIRQRQQQQLHERQQWWLKSVVKRSVPAIEANVRHGIENSYFLQREGINNTQEVAFFHRSEIVTNNKIVGSGGFSEVYEIIGFELNPYISERCNTEQQKQRQYMVSNAILDNGRGRYALKHLKQRLARSPQDFQRAAIDLASEAAYMSALDHPNILKVRGLPVDGIDSYIHGDHDGYFIITDRLEKTLGDLINDWNDGICKVISIEERAEYALQIAKALQYLHDNRICYRDLKPNNVGVNHDGTTIQLFDFGLCRELPSNNNNDNDNNDDNMNEVYRMSEVGTRRYMACEIITTGRYNLKADVYSWSMVVWELLSLHKPYEQYNMEEHQLYVCLHNKRPTLNHIEWPQWICNILQNSWTSNVHNRWTMYDIVETLSDALSSTSTILPPPPPPPESPAAVHQFFFMDDDNIDDDTTTLKQCSLPLLTNGTEEDANMVSNKLLARVSALDRYNNNNNNIDDYDNGPLSLGCFGFSCGDIMNAIVDTREDEDECCNVNHFRLLPSLRTSN